MVRLYSLTAILMHDGLYCVMQLEYLQSASLLFFQCCIFLTDPANQIWWRALNQPYHLAKCTSLGLLRGVLGQERVGTTFPHLFPYLLYNELKSVLKWPFFWIRSHTSFVSNTSLVSVNAYTTLKSTKRQND